MIQHATFSMGHASYLIGKLNWTPLPFQAKKSMNIPNRRYLHTAITYQGKLYILGGIDNETDLKDNRMYCLELGTMKWTIIEGKNFCESRNSHSCALFKNQIYFFGGSQHQSNPSNDFFKFSPALNTWSQIQCEETVPAERELAILASMNDQYIFLYGGIDILEDKIFDDAYLYKNEKWHKLTISNNPSERIKMGIAICGRRIFVFGGEGPGEQSSALYNNLYEIVINEYELDISFREICSKNSKLPQRRTAHGMTAISQRFFLVFGGEGRLAEDNGSVVDGYILGDIWIYDVEEMSWAEIEILYGTMTPRYEFSIAVHKNQVFIFGGMNEEHIVIDDLAKLEFMEDRHQTNEICTLCERQYSQKSLIKPAQTLEPLLSTGFYYNLALEITFPFRAIEMIAEIAEELGSESIKIYSSKTIEQFDYMNFEFAAKTKLQSSTFLNLIQSNENPFEASILYSLKTAALRLGKTFLYIEASDQQRKVFLMSADNRYSPNFEQSFIQYSYVENLKDCETYYGCSFGDKQTIYNILKSQVDDPYSLLSRNSGNILVVFQINILPTVEKAYYYELIFYSHPDCDIKIYHNEKKNELLESIGYNITNLPDFSLRNYLKYSKLKRKIKTFLNNDDNTISTESYLEYLRKQKNLGMVQELSLGKFTSKILQKCVVYRCFEDKYLQNNQGILVYCGNYLIDRYDCKLGQLISDKFYKKRYKKRSNIFKYVGAIYLSASLKLNHFKTRVQNRFKYNEIIQEFINKIKSAKPNERTQELELSQLYSRLILNRQTSKKIKRDGNA